MAAVQGYCPMGCGPTLIITEGGFVVCSVIRCPRPEAASTILADRETEHVVYLGETDFTVRHPLRERLDDALLQCDLNGYLRGLAGPPRQVGWYRARRADDGWTWESLDGDQ